MSIALLSDKVPNRRLTAEQRGAIVALFNLTLSYAETARLLRLNESTVRTFLKNARNNDSMAPKIAPGRPRITNIRTDRSICREAKRNSRMPLAELESNIQPVVNRRLSRSAIQRRLKDVNIRKWRAKQRPELELKHAKARLA